MLLLLYNSQDTVAIYKKTVSNINSNQNPLLTAILIFLVFVWVGCSASSSVQSTPEDVLSYPVKEVVSGNNPQFGFAGHGQCFDSGETGYRAYGLPSIGTIRFAVLPVINKHVDKDHEDRIYWESEIGDLPDIQNLEAIFSADKPVGNEELSYAPWGTVKQYFAEVSSGRCILQPTVVDFSSLSPSNNYAGWYLPDATYQDDSENWYGNIFSLIDEAIDAAGNSISAYDNQDYWSPGEWENDNITPPPSEYLPTESDYYDCIVVLVLDPDDQSGGDNGWEDGSAAGEHRGFQCYEPRLDSGPMIVHATGGDKVLGSLVVINTDAITWYGIRTICHELLHAMGLKDHYNAQIGDSSDYYHYLSDLTLMTPGGSIWQGSSSLLSCIDEDEIIPSPPWLDVEDYRPTLTLARAFHRSNCIPHISVYEKYLLGWVDPVDFTAVHPGNSSWQDSIELDRVYDGDALLLSSSTGIELFRDYNLFNTTSDDQFLLVENRGMHMDCSFDRYRIFGNTLDSDGGLVGWYVDTSRIESYTAPPAPLDYLEWYTNAETNNLFQLAVVDYGPGRTLLGSNYWSASDLATYIAAADSCCYHSPHAGVMISSSFQYTPHGEWWGYMPVSMPDTNGAIQVKASAIDPCLTEVLSLESSVSALDSLDDFSMWISYFDSGFSVLNPPSAYIDGQAFTVNYYELQSKNGPRYPGVLATSSTWGPKQPNAKYSFWVDVAGSQIQSTSDRVWIEAEITNSVENRTSVVTEPLELLYEKVISLSGGEILIETFDSGLHGSVFIDNSSHVPDNADGWHGITDSLATTPYGVVNRVLYAGQVEDDGNGNIEPLGYSNNTDIAVVSNIGLSFKALASAQIELKLRYELDESVEEDIWPTIGRDDVLTHDRLFFMFGNRCEFMLAKEAGIPFTSWSPVLECTLNGQTPSGRSESWSTGYDTYIVDLDTDYVAGLASSDKVVGIRFVSNDHTCFSGVRIDYILVTGVASSGM